MGLSSPSYRRPTLPHEGGGSHTSHRIAAVSLTPASCRTPASGRCRSACSAPSSPTALGRWKIQFCQAVRRAKIFDSIVSGPPKRRLASRPVSPSGEKLARSSRKTRTSSSQSMSSSAKVTRPSRSAASASSALPISAFAASTIGRIGEEAAREPRQPVRHRIGAEIDVGERERGRRLVVAVAAARSACRSGRWRTRARRACRQSRSRARPARPASAR